ncbi:MAG: alpha/beta hydrolase [Acidithiobacillus sp.]
MSTRALILPGIGNSSSEHWQSLWERANSSFLRVEQRDWERPVCEEWVKVGKIFTGKRKRSTC